MATITPTQYAQMTRTARDFESMFVTRMLESAASGLKTKGDFFGGNGEAQFRSLLNEQYGKEIARHGGFGIADAVLSQMLRMQEAQP
jgi:Rod binding domain-containing protein